LGLAPVQIAMLSRALELLATDPYAPSSVRGVAAVDVHVADSLSALTLECVVRARVVADLGSGAGFPDWFSRWRFLTHASLSSRARARRCEFLERLCGVAEIGNARVVHARRRGVGRRARRP